MRITKLFKNTGTEVWSIPRNLTEDEMEKTNFHFRVEVLEGGMFNFYLDGELVGSRQETGDVFEGGYIGVMSHFAKVVFNNVEYTPPPPPSSPAWRLRARAQRGVFPLPLHLHGRGPLYGGKRTGQSFCRGRL